MTSPRTYRVIVFVVAAVGLFAQSSYARPQFLALFNQDPFSRPEYRNQCSTCHINPAGSGPRNPFGAAFEQNNKTITPALRAAWPDRFSPSVSSSAVPAGGTSVQATFLANGETIVKIGEQYFRLLSTQATLEPITAEEMAQLTGGTQPPAPSKPQEAKLPLRDQPTFDHYLVNLPTTLPYRKYGVSLRFTHRFAEPVLQQGSPCQDCAGITDLYGLDSFSYSSFGVEAGITSHLAATFYRSPLDKTYEFGAVLQIHQQKGDVPVSVSFRTSLETRSLFVSSSTSGQFEHFQTGNFALPISHAISNVAEIFVVPMLSLRANPLPPPSAPFVTPGELRRNLGAVGLGASVRFRPRTAFVAEWVPRVGGYHPEDSANAFSFGLQRTTNGHVFELVLTNTLGTTTSEMSSMGTHDYALGFNIYRRLH